MPEATAAARPDPGRGAAAYRRHRSEQTLLYRIVASQFPAFVELLAGLGRPLPDYVQQEFVAYLKCGRLAHGFLRVHCESCHAEHLVASCCPQWETMKSRGPQVRYLSIPPGTHSG